MASSNRRTAYIVRNTNETKIQLSLSLDGGPLDLLPATAEFQNHRPRDHDPETPPEYQNTKTHASQISNLQHIWIWTGIGFLDHMLHAWAKHAGWSLRIRCRGDLASMLDHVTLNARLRGDLFHLVRNWLMFVPIEVDDHHTTEDTFLALGTAFTTALGPRTGLARFGYAYAPLDEALSRVVLDISSRPFFVGDFGFQGPMMGNLNTQMIHHGLGSWAQNAGVTLHIDVLKGENDHHRAESAFKALAVACKGACERLVGREGEVVSTKGVL
ncbi:MAG: hypothetical protein LQ339_007189 [Xanthoria mediterranea]|nr:MAG: hypothetical protein LQ339_007189 [Xanthoria mediterranea]